MIKINNQKLSVTDKKVIKQFVTFVLEKFCSNKIIKHANITIKFVDPRKVTGKDRADLKEFKAWMTRSAFDKNHFVITLSTQMFHKSKNLKRRMRHALLCLGHELIHIKQYMNGEMCDYANGDCGFKGKRYKNWEAEENYWFSPWELEAYSYELALFSTFVKTLKNNSSVV